MVFVLLIREVLAGGATLHLLRTYYILATCCALGTKNSSTVNSNQIQRKVPSTAG